MGRFVKILVVLGCSLGSLTSVKADDSSFFDHNYAATGIVQSGSSRIAPEVKAPEHSADQMLQTEAKPVPKSEAPSRTPSGTRPKSYAGRFVTRGGGTEARRVPQDLGEVGTDLP